VIDADLKSHM